MFLANFADRLPGTGSRGTPGVCVRSAKTPSPGYVANSARQGQGIWAASFRSFGPRHSGIAKEFTEDPGTIRPLIPFMMSVEMLNVVGLIRVTYARPDCHSAHDDPL